MFTVNRPIIAQQFDTYGLLVTNAAQPLAPQFQITALIDVFIITVPAAAANSVIIGSNAGVTAGPPPTGLELIAGTSVLFRIDHDGRQLYELQKPSFDIQEAVKCITTQPEAIPFIVWDLSQIFVVAVANTSISFATFKAMYI
jgi:hypothetical protein